MKLPGADAALVAPLSAEGALIALLCLGPKQSGPRPVVSGFLLSEQRRSPTAAGYTNRAGHETMILEEGEI
jgi:hypothetical protein